MTPTQAIHKLISEDMNIVENIDQVIYDLNCFKRNIVSIDKANIEKELFVGKPKHNSLLDAIDLWERDNKEILKSLKPYLNELTNKINKTQ